MNLQIRKFVSLFVALYAFGCVQQKVEELGGPVEIFLRSTDGPAGGVPVKIVDEAAVAKALGTLALHQDLKSTIAESVYSEFFNTLALPKGASVLKTKRDGRVLVKQVGLPHFVVAQEGQHLWVADAAEVHDHRLRMGPDTMGGQHALNLLIAQPGVLRELTAATMEMVRQGKIDQARAIARCARSRALMNEIDWEEAAPLLAGAEHALQQKDYDTARQLANRVDDLIPNQPRTKKLLDAGFRRVWRRSALAGGSQGRGDQRGVQSRWLVPAQRRGGRHIEVVGDRRRAGRCGRLPGTRRASRAWRSARMGRWR